MFTDRRQHSMWSYYDWVYCCCRPSVNMICGRIMIGLSLLSSDSKHNMWSYYDWVVDVFVSKHNMWSYYDWVVFINPIIIRQHCMFTDKRQQRQPNQNTTTYCVYGRKKTTGRIIIGLSLLSSVSKHNVWSYYDWVVVFVFRQ
jgi:hypothetical protein